MLDFIRQRSQGWLAWGIVILIIIPFALWGVQQYVGGGGEINVATVNGERIGKQRLEVAYYRQRQRLQQMFGENFNPDMFPEEAMKQQLLEDLIEQEVVRQAAISRGMTIGDKQLAQTILSIPTFQVDGKFSQQAYESALVAQGMQPGYFEYQVRRDLLNEQYNNAVSQSAFVTAAEVEVYQQLKMQQRNVGWMIIPASSFEDQVVLTDSDIEQHYNDNQSLYRQPEQVKVAYVELSVKQLSQEIDIPEADLEARYEAQKSNFVAPEQRRARHILIKVAKDADEASEKAAHDKANILRERILTGESLEELAPDNSDDPGSRGQGGDLGFFMQGQMVESFDTAVFSMQPGELSDLVRSEYGYHIIELVEIKASEPKQLVDVREQLLAEMRREIASEHFYELAEQLTNLSYEHPDTLQIAADAIGLEVKVSEPFSKNGGGGVFSNPKVISAAFSDEVLLQGNNSEVIEVADDQLIVLRLVENIPERTRALSEIRDGIASTLKRNKSRELAIESAVAVVEQLVAGVTTEVIASANDAEWQTDDALQRDSQTTQRDLLEAIFRLPHPNADEPSFVRIGLQSGDQAVVALYSVQAGKADGSDEDHSTVQRSLYKGNSASSSDGITQMLKGAANIKRMEL